MQELHVTDRRSNGAVIARLIRLPNLILLIAIQIFVFLAGHPESWDYLALIVSMTACVTAAGYVINDMTDIDADRINDRYNVIAKGHISVQAARKSYIFFITVGAMASAALSMKWSFHFLWMYAGATLILWMYSRFLKAMPAVGNLVVSLFCGTAVLVVWFPVVQFDLVPQKVLLLSGFAFLVTMVREIIKDMEDISGDLAVGDRTLPIVSGIFFSKAVVMILLLIAIVALFILTVRQTPGLFPLICYGLTMGLLVFAGLRLMIKRNDKTGYHRISTILKIAMFFGTLSLLF